MINSSQISKKHESMKRLCGVATSTKEFIPFSNFVDSETIQTNNDFVRTIVLDGVPFETLDNDRINGFYLTFHNLIRSLASPNVAIWHNLVRIKTNEYPEVNYAVLPEFEKNLGEKYKQKILKKILYRNQHYISVIYRPEGNGIQRAFSFFEKKDRNYQNNRAVSSLKALNEITQDILTCLTDFNPRLLTTYKYKDNLYSETLEFYSYLINGEFQKTPVTKTAIHEILGTSELFFGHDSFVIKGADFLRSGACLAIKEYPNKTNSKILDELLKAPFEFNLAQSFTFLPKGLASAKLRIQQRKMINAGDLAESQIDEISDALDDLTSNRFVYGVHHLSLVVFSDKENLIDTVSKAKSILSEGGGILVAREGLSLTAAYYAQLPTNFKFRPRTSAITTKNFACLAPLHNYQTGKPKNNHWGDAICMFETASGNPYYYNFHVKDTGCTFISGQTGAGKTVLLGFLMTCLKHKNVKIIFIDKDKGAEILIRALNGNYRSFKYGKPTGLNPFQVENTVQNRILLISLIEILARNPNKPHSAKDRKDLKEAVEGVMDLPMHMRGLSELVSFLDKTKEDGIYAHLLEWTREGKNGWVFDNIENKLNVFENDIFGFDITDFLDVPEIRTPLTFYLLTIINQKIDGTPFAIIIDEFWKILDDETFTDFAKNKLKVIRKQNGIVVFATQSPSDAAESKISRTIISQCSTKIFLPDPEANYDDYVKHFGLTEKEYETVKNFNKHQRYFLVKQQSDTIANAEVVRLDLSGFDDELKVLSSTLANVIKLDKIRSRVGDDSKVWMPIFLNRKKK